MSKSAKFRQYAHECVELAERATTGSHRALMLSVATTWLKLADEAQREAELSADDRDIRFGKMAASPPQVTVSSLRSRPAL